MNAFQPYAGNGSNPTSVVGFVWKGMSYTPESPCLVLDDLVCTQQDWSLWKGHVLEWIGKVKPIDPAAYQKLARRYADLVARNDATTMTRMTAIRALISLAQLARMILVEQHGVQVTDIKNDWGDVGSIGWPIAEDVVFEVKKMFDEAKKKIQGHVTDRWSLYLVGGGLLLWLYMTGGRRR